MPHPKSPVCDLLVAQAREHLHALRVHDALDVFRRAEAQQADPDLCAAGRWHCHMLLGEFEDAWKESDAIHSRANPDPNRFWDGKPIAGNRILVRCLHGLGDTLQFIRYVPLLRTMAPSVTIEAQPALKALLAQSSLADTVITWSEQEPEWDQQIEVMELPRMFRTRCDEVPNNTPYIRVDPSVEQPIPPSRGLPRVGIVWQSSSFNPARSIPIEQIATIFSSPNIAFYALQPGPEHHNVRPWTDRILDLHGCLDSIEKTAAIVSQLDLVITVDTMMAHLAGAMAVPVWTLLPYECDWRWMLNREDSPWYPTMRLFRQPEPGNWSPVVQRVFGELQLPDNQRTAKVNRNGHHSLPAAAFSRNSESKR